MKKIIPILAASLFFAGCATAPVPANQARSVPTSRLLAGYSAVSAPAIETGRVTFVRDSGMLGAGPSAMLSIDGTDIAKLRTRERLDVYLKPGSHIFGVAPSPQLGGALTEASFNITADKRYYFRISVAMGGDLSIQPSTQLN